MSGDLSLAHATGEVVVDTKSGDIDLHDLRGSAVRARMLSGDVSRSLISLIPQTARAKMEAGGVNLEELVRAIRDGEASGRIVDIKEPGGASVEGVVE